MASITQHGQEGSDARGLPFMSPHGLFYAVAISSMLWLLIIVGAVAIY